MQSIVVEFILTHVDRLFGNTALPGECPPAQHVTASGSPGRAAGPRGHLGQSPILQMRKLSLRAVLLTAQGGGLEMQALLLCRQHGL